MNGITFLELVACAKYRLLVLCPFTLLRNHIFNVFKNFVFTANISAGGSYFYLTVFLHVNCK